MRRDDTADPLHELRSPGRGYAAYLRDLRAVYKQVARLLRAGAAR